MSLRTKAAQHARLSNEAHQEAIQAEKDRRYFQKVKDILRDFAGKSDMFIYTAIYGIVLLLDVVVSSPLLAPLASKLLRSERPLAYMICGGIYAGIIFSLTLLAAKAFNRTGRNNLQLLVNLNLAYSTSETEPEIKKAVREESRYAMFRGMAWSITLLLFVTGLGVWRSYLGAGHQLQTKALFGSELMTILIPLCIAVILIVIGRYKTVVWKYFQNSRNLRKAKLRVLNFKALSTEEAMITADLIQQADQIGELPLSDKALENCLYRIRHIDVSNEAWLSEKQPRTLTVKVIRSGNGASNIIVEAFTAERNSLSTLTDHDGLAVLTWKSVESFLTLLKVNGSHIRGIQFEDNQSIVVDLDRLGQEKRA